MKKFLAVSIVLLVCAFSLANTAPSQQIEQLVKSNGLVKQAYVVVLGDSCVVAVKTVPIFFTRQYKELADQIKTTVVSSVNDINNVYVSYDLDVFLQTQKISQQLENGTPVLETKEQILDLINLIEKRK